MYQITVQSVFAAAHAIRLYDGELEPVHGHDWNVRVTIAAEELDEIEVVMDFHVLEEALAELLDRFHNRHLNEVEPFADGLAGGGLIGTEAETSTARVVGYTYYVWLSVVSLCVVGNSSHGPLYCQRRPIQRNRKPVTRNRKPVTSPP